MSNEHHDNFAEWREYIGQQLMIATTCTHKDVEFGPGAVCNTCYENVQRAGRIAERAAARAWDQGREAEKAEWVLTADLATPDEDRRPQLNPYHNPEETA